MITADWTPTSADAWSGEVEMMFPNPANTDEPLRLRLKASGGTVDLTAARMADGAPVFRGRALRA